MSDQAAALLRWTARGLYRAGLSRPLSVMAGYAGLATTFPILTFHRVNDEGDPFFPALPTEVFERQMAFVSRTYLVLPVEQLVERMRQDRLPRNALAITFDDGYRDNLTHAAPILARYGLPATVFLVTGVIGTGQNLWFDQLALAFKRTRASAWCAPWGEDVPLGTASERLVALDHTQGRLKRMADEERQRTLAQVMEALEVSDEASSRDLMLSWEDVHTLTGLGITIGAHTVSHPILSRLSAERARFEIERSRAMIAAACGRPPRSFAYPNGRAGDYTEAIASIVREAGFSCAVTTRFGVNTVKTPPYELRRGGPWERDVPTFALKLATYRLTQA